MSNYNSLRKFSDQFEPAFKCVAGLLTFSNNYYLDKTENTDLIVLSGKQEQIACRVRRHEYYKKFPNDFTVRYSIPYGVTEFEKIKNGFGTIMIYAFAMPDKPAFVRWTAISLHKLRRVLIDNNGIENTWREKDNSDGTTFKVIPLEGHSQDIVMAQWDMNRDGSSFSQLQQGDVLKELSPIS